MINKNKKGSPVVAIGILVLLVGLLISMTLFYFYTKTLNVNKKIYPATDLNKVYLREDFVNFYIQDILDRAVKESTNQEIFNSNIVKYTEKYKDKNGDYLIPELQQIRGQLSNIGIFYGDNGNIKNVQADFEVVLKEKFVSEGKEVFSIEYKYTKTFISSA